MVNIVNVNKRDRIKLMLSSLLLGVSAPWPLQAQQRGKSIIVIGAGLAGLSAAKTLQNAGHQVTVLEGRERIGGRIWTSHKWPEMPLDLGATWIHGTKGNPLTAVADSINAQRLRTNYESAIAYWFDGKPLSKAQAQLIEQWKRRIEKRLDAVQDADELAFDISVRNAISPLLNGLDAKSEAAQLIHFILNSTLEQEYGSSIDQLSAQRFDAAKEFSGGDQLFSKGFQVITQYLSKDLNIKLGHVVKSIDYTGSQLTVTSSKGSVQADAVVVTLPLGVLKSGHIQFKPDLPRDKINSLDKLQMGVLNKCYLRFEKVLWPTDIDWMEVLPQKPGHWTEWVSFMQAAQWPVLLGFNAADRGREIEHMSDAEIVQDAMQTLKRMFGSNIPNPIDAQITRWAQDPFSLGSYSFNPVGYRPKLREILAEPISKKVFFAGEATHKDYFGTAHGAYLSGIRAAKEVLAY